mmetsp:Transcript_33657/g.38728  ORF Transcript_33657/g.38728 Transcript_33657/m.38728 type:complete len:93 (+) Transcript_33657:531-809(+)
MWSRIFDDNLMYHPFYENYPHNYSVAENTFVYFGYFKPMKHEYVVLEAAGTRVYHNAYVSLPREADIKIVNKEYNQSIVQREFIKESSVFAP